MTLANDINRFFDKPANRRKVLLGIGGYCLVAVAFSGLQRLSERVAAPAPAPAPVAVAAPAPVAEPAHELAWLAQDPALAKRMHAECGDLTKVQCETYWEIKRAERGAGERETYGEFLERGRQRSNDLAFCRQNPSDWYCRNGQYSGQY